MTTASGILAALACGRSDCVCAASARRGSGLMHCPVHHDVHPSLSVGARGGRTIVHCFGGCSQRAVLDALRDRGLWGAGQIPPTWRSAAPDDGAWSLPSAPSPAATLAVVERLWASSVPDHPRVAAYLRHRGLNGAVPSALRFHPSLLYLEADRPRRFLPGMIGRFQLPDGAVVGLHRTFLDPLGPGKATVAASKKFIGHVAGAAIHFGEPVDGRLGVAEGIETALAVAEARGVPVWSAGSASGLAALELPSDLAKLDIFADPDSAGRSAAEQLATRARHRGVVVDVFLPPAGRG